MNASIRLVESLARHTAWRTGGWCDAWVVPHDAEAVRTLFVDAKRAGWRLLLLGAGTRTVVRDAGFDGVVARLGPAFSGIERTGGLWWVGAATPVPALRVALAHAGHDDLPELAGVAGSVGASVLLESELWRGLHTLRTVRRGRVREEAPEAALGRGRVAVLAVALTPGSKRPASLGRTSTYALERGDLFRLLRQTQLPGARLRGITICRAAPELIANVGGGTSADVRLVQRSVIDRVRAVHNVTLKSCLRFEGLSAPRRSE